jgi:hypothetical protein
VSVQALSTSSLDHTADLIGTEPGNRKQLVMHGLLWAPRHGVRSRR